MSQPDVTIVLIAFNDAARLPRALASAQQQTLANIEIIVVDDASTDSTAQVVRDHAKLDPRIRLLQRAVNSGGCSAPRNDGVAAARGTWVMFCDSDDTLEPHAAKNLLLAVEGADADLGCGVAERIVVDTKKTKRWRVDAHTPGVVAQLGDRPELLFDTICVNKIYRRQWLIDQQLGFVDDLLYEDQLFTLQCFLRANRIAVIDETVYFWHVDRLSDEPSITQRRHELANVLSRIEINRRIDAELADDPELLRAKTVKYLRHDLYLYLASMLSLDDATVAPMMQPLADYTSTCDLSLAAQVRPGLRVAIYHLLLGDIAGIRAAMRTVKWSAVLDRPIAHHDGCDFWACTHLDGGPPMAGFDASWWLDITALHPSRAPIPQQRPCHVVSTITMDGTLRVTGSTVDAYGVQPHVTDIDLVVVGGAEMILTSGPVTWDFRDGCFHWSGTLRRIDRGYLALRMIIGASANVTPVRALDVASTAGGQMRSGEFGTVRLEPARTSRRVLRRLGREVTSLLAPLLPRKRGVLFGAKSGVELGTAEAMSRLLNDVDPTFPQWWVEHRGSPPAPAWVTSIAASSARHRRVTRAVHRHLTDQPERDADVFLPNVPSVLNVGSADPDQRDPKIARKRRALAKSWQQVVGPDSNGFSQWCVDMDYEGETRAQALLVEAVRITDPGRVRAVLDIDGPVVAYFAAGEPAPDWVDLARALDGDAVLLVHNGLRTSVSVPAELRAWVRDARSIAVAEVLAICDVFVTDAAPETSVAADRDLPIVVYTPSLLDLQTRGPGLAFDVSRLGSIAENGAIAADLVRAALRDGPSAHARQGMRDFVTWGLGTSRNSASVEWLTGR
jgi:glycosyltransferase involved in cell wall biosynthesis